MVNDYIYNLTAKVIFCIGPMSIGAFQLGHSDSWDTLTTGTLKRQLSTCVQLGCTTKKITIARTSESENLK